MERFYTANFCLSVSTELTRAFDDDVGDNGDGDVLQSIRALIGDFQNPNRTRYKLAHAFFTEGNDSAWVWERTSAVVP